MPISYEMKCFVSSGSHFFAHTVSGLYACYHLPDSLCIILPLSFSSLTLLMFPQVFYLYLHLMLISPFSPLIMWRVPFFCLVLFAPCHLVASEINIFKYDDIRSLAKLI